MDLLLAISGNGQCDECGEPGQGNISYTYDASGNKLSITDAAGSVETIQYAPGTNAPTLVTDALNLQRSYGYDSLGNLTQLTDPLGVITRLAYDANGYLTQASDSSGNSAKVTLTTPKAMPSHTRTFGEMCRTSATMASRDLSLSRTPGPS